MNESRDLIANTIFGQLVIAEPVWTSWLITVVMVAFSIVVGSRLQEKPGALQTAVEGVVEAMHRSVEAVIPGRSVLIFSFVSTLWLFILAANLIGIIPGLSSPTKNLSVTTALALIVFFSVHWFGIRSEGLKSYLHHYLTPTPLMLPFHIISEISRTVALAVRLFGNMMSLEMAALMVLLVAGFLIPVPLLMLHIVEALVQAYIFGMLALIFIASGIESQSRIRSKGG